MTAPRDLPTMTADATMSTAGAPAGGAEATEDVTAPDRHADRTLAPRVERPSLWPALVVALLALGAYLVLSLARWNRWEAPSWDNGIFEQAIRGWAGFGWPVVDIKGEGYIQLGDHWSPLLVVIAPFYRLFPGPVTLLVAQAVLVAISVVPLTHVARRWLGNLAGLGVGVAYAASWGVQSAMDVQFHEYALAAPILAFGLAAALDGRWRPACAWLLLLLGVKEDMGLTVAGFGVVLWFWGERRRAWQMVAAGLGGMALTLFVLIPIFNPWNRYDYWGKLGEDGAAVEPGGIAGLIGGVWRILTHLFVPDVKLETLALLVIVTAFAALRSPLLIMIVPTMLWRFAGSTEHYWGSTWHYSLILMPIVFAATIDGVRLLRTSPHAAARGFARAVPALTVVVAAVLVPHFPFGDLADPATYERPASVASGERALASIPAGASVASDLGLIVHLTRAHTVYWIGTESSVAPQYVAIRTMSGWGGNPPDDVARYAASRFGGVYEVSFDEGGYQVARRIG
ncbi:DUF2079 domain-containing protein [Sanguibacter sp. A247]|uniref:DUF2079 domain-containing protein n=1 Tax=unclassified Sanguibacter TaxID=2645534 RepID=UPI003FD6E0B2